MHFASILFFACGFSSVTFMARPVPLALSSLKKKKKALWKNFYPTFKKKAPF